jgi:hypothetical protein
VPVGPAILVSGALLGLAALGCGAWDRESAAAAVAERFHAAVGQRDGIAACAELSGETRSDLEQQEGAPCQEAVLSLELPTGGEAAVIDVFVRSASVDLVEGGTTFLEEGSGGWKVSAAGCTPTAPDLPYDCVLEG